MNLLDYLQRMLDEQSWREKEAQKLSSGLGSMPYNFQEQMNIRAPGLLNQFDISANRDAQSEERINSIADQLGPKPSWFDERFQLNNMLDKYRQGYQKKMKEGGV